MRSRSLILIAAASLCGCSTLDHLAKPPSFSQPGDQRNAPPSVATPSIIASGGPATFVPATPGSLWRSGPESLFGDRRARKAGDIVTVIVEIDDNAEIKNRTERKKSGSDDISIPALLGAEAAAVRALGGSGLDPAVSASSSASSSGDGTIKREDKIALKIAATVSGVLPNGHLIVAGSQEVRVNYELRDLSVTGVIRPEDISRLNTITYDKIANARISYGGRGQITDLQRARYGQQIVDIISPF